MDIQDFKKSLKEISDSQDIGLELYLINKDSNIQFANISKDSAKNLLSIFKDNISTLFLDEEDVKLKTMIYPVNLGQFTFSFSIIYSN